ncbi:MlaD family protein [Spirochaeta cellobiosiphila]|uniref:MlaD family protein n=1 Tax=Spirochaeta cellobiosiphila TaxID=504483 RepID=UPI0004919F6B|nr:MlaD family protein [Spirochaeta cellobiosiphila]
MSKYVKIGMLVSFSVLGVIMFMLLTAESINKGDTILVTAYLNDATGLLPESKVRIHGVVVGNIKDIVLEDGKARVDMEISRDIPLYEDASFEKKMESLLGTASVSLEPGTATHTQLKKGAVIHNVQSGTAMEQTMDTLEEVSGISSDFIKQIINQVQGRDGQIGYNNTANSDSYNVLTSSIKSINMILSNMERISSSMSSNSDASIQQFNLLIESLNQLTYNLNRMMVQNEGEINSSLQSIDQSLALLAKQMESGKDILAQVQGITTAIESGQGNLGKLINDDELYNRVINLTETAEDTINSTIGIDLGIDYHTDYLVNQNSGRTEVGLKLTPRNKNKYYALGLSYSPYTEKIETTTAETTGATTETTVTTKVSSTWAPYIQLAYIYGPLTLRGGLIEGKGGFGVDYQPVNFADLSIEAFDFDPIQQPKLRIGSTLTPFMSFDPNNPLSWVYITGGVDDILGQDQRDYYFGAGLHFTDNDLKGISSFASILN